MGADNGGSAEPSKKRHLLKSTRARIYIVVAVLVSASVVTVGWELVRQERGLVFSTSTDEREYSPGEQIRVSAEFTNFGFDSVVLTFNTSQMASFSVYASDGSLVGGIPMLSLQVITEKTVRPGHSVEFGVTWDQIVFGPDAPTGAPVPFPDSYYIIAHAMSIGFQGTAHTEVFTITGT